MIYTIIMMSDFKDAPITCTPTFKTEAFRLVSNAQLHG